MLVLFCIVTTVQLETSKWNCADRQINKYQSKRRIFAVHASWSEPIDTFGWIQSCKLLSSEFLQKAAELQHLRHRYQRKAVSCAILSERKYFALKWYYFRSFSNSTQIGFGFHLKWILNSTLYVSNFLSFSTHKSMQFCSQIISFSISPL